jgi:HlyD family secretion protein
MLIAWVSGCDQKSPDYLQGYVEGDYVFVTASAGGTLEKLMAHKGQTVAQGAALFELDPNPEALQIEEIDQRLHQAKSKLADIKKGGRPSELNAVEARLRKARASLAIAERDYQRRLNLFEAGHTDAIAEEELERFRAEVDIRRSDVEAMEAELSTARLGGREDAVAAAQNEVYALAASKRILIWQLEEKRVTAPAAGLIHDIYYRVGEFVPAGRPVISLLPPQHLKIRFFVPQASLPSIQAGDSVRVVLDGAPSAISAKISFISPEAEFTPPVIYSRESRTKLVFMIEALPDAAALNQLHVGQPLEVFLREPSL